MNKFGTLETESLDCYWQAGKTRPHENSFCTLLPGVEDCFREVWFFILSFAESGKGKLESKVDKMRFQVIKAINNNVVSCVDEAGCEHIVMGRGLGFQAKELKVINEEDVEKVFRITNQSELERLKRVFTQLPQEQMEVCTQIIQYACDILKRDLNESIYYTLADHINFAIQRQREGIYFTNALDTEVRLFYPQEYAVGLHALEEIHRMLGVQLSEEEASSIALHIVNAEYDNSLGITMLVTKALGNMLQILNHWETIEIDHESLYCDELIVHMKFLALSVFSDTHGDRREPAFVNLVRTSYPREFGCASAVADYLEENSGHKVSDEKKAYLAIHLHRVNRME